MIESEDTEGLRPGQLIASERYELKELLGRGGLAVVLAAYDRVEDREVALKVLRTRYVGRPEREERLRREFEYARRVTHPSIIQVYDEGALEGGRPLFSMERVRGQPLSQVLAREGRLAIDRLIALARALADALDALHSQGLVHRDVKPANVLVLDDGRLKLIDLGMAGDENAPAVPVGHGARLTRANDLLGTHEYMAPEQVFKAPPHRSMDVFAFGIVMYEMLAGISPYSGMKAREYVELQLDGDPHVRSAERWARLRGAPQELAVLLDDCRHRDPGLRPDGMGEVIKRLDKIREHAAVMHALVPIPQLETNPRARGPLPLAPATAAGKARRRLEGAVCDARVPRRMRGSVRWLAVFASATAVLGAWRLGAVRRPAKNEHEVELKGNAWEHGSAVGDPQLQVSMRPDTKALLSPTAGVAHHPPRVPTEVDPPPPSTTILPSSVGRAVTQPTRPAIPTHVTRAKAHPPPRARLPPKARRQDPPSTPSKDPEGPAPQSTDAEEDCDEIRLEAEAAMQRRDWPAVLRISSHEQCWTHPVERLRLRVHALAQLQRWTECIEAGQGSSDRIIAKWVALCEYHSRDRADGA